MKYIYLDYLIDVNKKICNETNEPFGVLNKNSLLSSLSVQDNNYYKNNNQLTSALLKSLVLAHGFIQANKRTAFIMIQDINPPKCDSEQLCDIILNIAKGDLKDLNIITNLLYEDVLNEDINEIKPYRKSKFKKAKGAIINPNAGNVEQGIAMFNAATTINSDGGIGIGGGMMEELNKNELYALIIHSDMTGISFALISDNKDDLKVEDLETILGLNTDYDKFEDYIEETSKPLIKKLAKKGIIYVEDESNDDFYKYNGKYYSNGKSLKVLSYDSYRF